MDNFDLKKYLAENQLTQEAEVTPLGQLQSLLRAAAEISTSLLGDEEYNEMYDWEQLSMDLESHADEISF